MALVLTRRVGETIVINGDIEVTITGMNRSQVRIGIAAPASVKIMRKELVGTPPKEKR